jgi:DNA modification methylase
MVMRDRVKELRRVPASELRANPRNWRTHPPAQEAALRGVLAEIGFADAMIARETEDGLELIDGHLRQEVMGDQEVPVLVLDVTEEEADKLLLTLDPLAMMAHADTDQLLELLRDNPFESNAVADMLEALVNGERDVMPDLHEPLIDPGPQMDKAEELREKWQTERGQVWEVGRHRLMCGDCTSPEDRKLLNAGVIPDFILTDPPYSSGGFQEAARGGGSIGTRHFDSEGKKIQPQITNDRLSTRGYMALIKRAVGEVESQGAYVFTDWRMWVNLFDVMESSGFGVRQMIVWDKGSPGMGAGWRSQHEIIMLACRSVIKFDNHKAVGNVRQYPRTGNPNHPTEKPVELLMDILNITDAAQTVYDPFLGSGSTLVAVENAGRDGYGMEIEPKYLAVTLERMAGMGLEPKLVE